MAARHGTTTTGREPGPTGPDGDLAAAVVAAHGALRAGRPLVACLTNEVVVQVTANALLAAGASPAMPRHPVEAAQLAGLSGGLLVNLGTVDDVQEDAAGRAVGAAAAAHVPWVLDPVAVGVLDHRTAIARDLVRRAPTAVRGNASEVMALAGVGAGGRGTDTTHGVDDAAAAAADLASTSGAVVAVSGKVDLVVAPDGRSLRVTGGSALGTRVTGFGCALGGVVAAYLATTPPEGDPLVAVAAAHAHVSAAAGRAAEGARGPGSFAVAWLDELDAVTAEDVAALVRPGAAA
ncbi:hydroxyethylthiazole kinase [Pseudokineococcus lusitanus]|uniref:Hydroxyethylthiazole kinase n=1 Tax=Pseudokineococcus lusitanus TaxID=763993 RepID=A0A3N1HTX2_9ACTN|nr:hydroxyethylthiazole kinase [Pseudokineococcus lusitanus]ROP45856.1 hydroxyethylthiazole kinase [Pseudokineococcus lusitanus]